jgi:hypothetical protein
VRCRASSRLCSEIRVKLPRGWWFQLEECGCWGDLKLCGRFCNMVLTRSSTCVAASTCFTLRDLVPAAVHAGDRCSAEGFPDLRRSVLQHVCLKWDLHLAGGKKWQSKAGSIRAARTHMQVWIFVDEDVSGRTSGLSVTECEEPWSSLKQVSTGAAPAIRRVTQSSCWRWST